MNRQTEAFAPNARYLLENTSLKDPAGDRKEPQTRYNKHTMRLWVLCCLVAWAIAATISVEHMRAQVPPGALIVFAGDLNGDSYADSVTGRWQGGAITLLPEAIFWGWDKSQPQPPPGFIPVTPIIYPSYPNLAGSAAFLHLNPAQDNLTDIVFFLWGRATSSPGEPDTGRTVAIFGQASLAAQHIINLSLLPDSVQTTPYYAQDLYIHQQLLEPVVRDLSDIDSYLLADLDTAGYIQPPHPVITQVGQTLVNGVEVLIYPNPSLYTATLQTTLPAGNYTARIIGVSGRVHQEQKIELGNEGSSLHTLDLSELASGYYMVQIERNGAHVGTYPFIIRR